MDQKTLFLTSEGDSWYFRNSAVIGSEEFIRADPVVEAVSNILAASPSAGDSPVPKLLEIGCSSGTRIEWLEKNARIETYGIEPSAAAVETAQARGLRVTRGTADSLGHEDASFDIVVFGFCLYVCDADDLFRIAAEAHRVLKPGGWVIIRDFYARAPVERDYHHVSGAVTRKMDYREMFTWHPDYVCYDHRVRHHSWTSVTDDPNEWSACSVLRRLPAKVSRG